MKSVFIYCEGQIGDYTKVRQGIIVAKKIDINKMISECKHFADWIYKIRNM